ncbi:MAG: sensor histidine kinase [Spirochaetia bacterium]|nr:sensor histidine kinase [Spirochaetia bacterium]
MPMPWAVVVQRYSTKSVRYIHSIVDQAIEGTWLAPQTDTVFQICDELLKNAVKSNYKFILLWQATRHRIMEEHPEFSIPVADSWLREVFFSGESVLIERQLNRLSNRDHIQVTVRKLLDFENQLRTKGLSAAKLSEPDLRALMQRGSDDFIELQKLTKELNIRIHLRIEKSSDELLITVSNDAPIMEEDVKRITGVRHKFREYCKEGRQSEFFFENLDTSGGGQGLGYAIMDAILLDMGLDPDKCLFLISASRTMVLLVLPLSPPAKKS